ncbi:hypothetical protein RRG08_018923 [Elysia crispata]|uniref:Uncharacterized protein n=1 Tax=Elysia crispata TaxID=231223 RepID=A0AAE1D116_9GAST|nr:hypothetical protein RRG08_018923 [Elysia crispata]
MPVTWRMSCGRVDKVPYSRHIDWFHVKSFACLKRYGLQACVDTGMAYRHVSIQVWLTGMCRYRYGLQACVDTGMAYRHVSIQVWLTGMCRYRYGLQACVDTGMAYRHVSIQVWLTGMCRYRYGLQACVDTGMGNTTITQTACIEAGMELDVKKRRI